jgi:hypothetical protein
VTQATSETAGTKSERPPWEWSVERSGPTTCLVRLAGSWRLRDHLPRAATILQQVRSLGDVERLTFETTGISAWDTGLLTFLRNLIAQSESASIVVDHSGLPVDVERLLALASTVPVRTTSLDSDQLPWLTRAGSSFFALGAGFVEVPHDLTPKLVGARRVTPVFVQEREHQHAVHPRPRDRLQRMHH